MACKRSAVRSRLPPPNSFYLHQIRWLREIAQFARITPKRWSILRYLIRSRHGTVFSFRVLAPIPLRQRLGRTEIRRSLGTDWRFLNELKKELKA